MRIDRAAIRRAVIREMYNTSLMQIFEQAPPADPAAAAAAAVPADPAAAAAAVPAVDPAAAAAPAVDPAAAAAAAAPVDPAIAAAGAAGVAAPAVPAVDPTAALAAAPAAVPAVPGAAPAVPGAAPAVPGAAPAAPAAPGAVPPPAPKSNETGKQEVFKALMTSTADAEAEAASESLRRRSLRVLFEQDEKKKEPKINMDMFAEKIANLIKNYTSLVDVKKNVIDQAESYLKSQFPDDHEDLSKKLSDLLRRQYRITLERPEPPPDSYAVGAKSGGGGAA
jgi:hypothetical protein